MKKIIITVSVTLILVLAILLSFLAIKNNNNELSETQPGATLTETMPGAPVDFHAITTTVEKVELVWKGPDNGISFELYRDGRLIKELPKDITDYIDYGLKPATSYEYEVFAVNSAGKTGSGIIIAKTNNPPVEIRLDMLGVADNGEDALREFVDKNGEIFVGVVVRDGKNVVTLRLPENGYYDLSDNSDIALGLTLFSTLEIGDYLKINVIGFESDGGKGEELLVQALDMAVKYYPGGLTSIILELAGIDLTSTFKDIIGFDDDFLGEYLEEWNQSDNWGIGSSKYIECNKGDGIGLRFSFTISSPLLP